MFVNAKKACAFVNAKVHWLHQTIKLQNVMKAYSEKNGCYYFGERVIIIFVFYYVGIQKCLKKEFLLPFHLCRSAENLRRKNAVV